MNIVIQDIDDIEDAIDNFDIGLNSFLKEINLRETAEDELNIVSQDIDDIENAVDNFDMNLDSFMNDISKKSYGKTFNTLKKIFDLTQKDTSIIESTLIRLRIKVESMKSIVKNYKG